MRTEKIFAIIFLIGLTIKTLVNSPQSYYASLGISGIALIGTALLYFPGAFYFFAIRSIKQQNLPLSIISGLFLSFIPLGILFRVYGFVGGFLLLLAGSVSSIVISIIVYFLKSKATGELAIYYKNMLTRTIVLTILAIIFILIKFHKT